MKRTLYITSIIVLIGGLAVSFVFIKLYNKPHTDTLNTPPKYTLSAGNLIQDFNQNEEKANDKYLDQVVQVKGIITSITTNNGKTILSLAENESLKNVVCTMKASENKKILQLQEGQSVTVRGICTGFLMDVMLVRTIMVNQQ